MKRGQISIEYLIVMGFIAFIVISLLGIAYFYAAGVKDRIKYNQLENFANKVISSAESVYFAGEPSKVTVTAFLPEGIESIRIEEQNLIFNFTTASGVSVIAFSSDVPIQLTGPGISIPDGLKRLQIEATSGGTVSIMEG